MFAESKLCFLLFLFFTAGVAIFPFLKKGPDSSFSKLYREHANLYKNLSLTSIIPIPDNTSDKDYIKTILEDVRERWRIEGEYELINMNNLRWMVVCSFGFFLIAYGIINFGTGTKTTVKNAVENVNETLKAFARSFQELVDFIKKFSLTHFVFGKFGINKEKNFATNSTAAL